MLIPLENVCRNIEGEFWAIRGLESGVQEQTEMALDIIQEVVHDIPDTEAISLIPVGSRFKGYATQSSDLDLVVVVYEHDMRPHFIRQTIGRVITERLGIWVCQPNFPDIADEALTIDMIDYGHDASFSSNALPFAITRTILEGARVSDLRLFAMEKRQSANDDYF